MRALLPYLALYKRHKWMLSLGIVLAIVTLLASIGLLTLFRLVPLGLSGCGGCRTVQLQLYATRCGRAWRSNHPYCRALF